MIKFGAFSREKIIFEHLYLKYSWFISPYQAIKSIFEVVSTLFFIDLYINLLNITPENIMSVVQIGSEKSVLLGQKMYI